MALAGSIREKTSLKMETVLKNWIGETLAFCVHWVDLTRILLMQFGSVKSTYQAGTAW